MPTRCLQSISITTSATSARSLSCIIERQIIRNGSFHKHYRLHAMFVLLLDPKTRANHQDQSHCVRQHREREVRSANSATADTLPEERREYLFFGGTDWSFQVRSTADYGRRHNLRLTRSRAFQRVLHQAGS